jgi:Asp-tRNA(Asn)/Glu-tRNA(Gln) amidotransferase A subunit family amidase
MKTACRRLLERIDQAQARVEARDAAVRALLPEAGRFDRLRGEARALCDRYPQPHQRPPLFGVLVGVKDIFHVDGYATHAGSRLPASALQGAEADAVSRLKRAGALIVGKTVTTEFAHFAPGPTRNPHDLDHTPGGSSSGSAAAVAAGFCDLALGTQTIGSIIRPASFCGVVGFKPTYDRVSRDGVIPLAPSLDHVGCLATDVATVTRAARVMVTTWAQAAARHGRPILGVPQGPYLEHASAETLEWFHGVCAALTEAGYELRRVALFDDFAEVRQRNDVIHAGEAARAHAARFAEYGHLYGPQITDLITRGHSVTDEQLQAALTARDGFRARLGRQMADAGVEAWICPSSVGPAPFGIESTGDPVMNLPWTHAGVPVVNLPAGKHRTGLPMGLQLAGAWHGDERLLQVASVLEQVTGQL